MVNGKFEVGQQVRVVGNNVNPFLSMLRGKETFDHAIAIGETATILEISEDTDEIKLDVSDAKITDEGANSVAQWVDPHHIEAVQFEVG